ncbi:MAG: molybdopterin molybdotransferase MoeA [Chitinophagaceae bacterium]
MISVAAAKKIITDNLLVLHAVKLPLHLALYRRLAVPVYSTVDVPAFAQSSMDGYAFAYADYQPGESLEIVGEVQAGAANNFVLSKGEAARIFTGAPLPAGADTVVMQEKVTVKDKRLSILDEGLQKGNSVRLQGSAIKKDELALEKNSYLSPGALGFLAGMGIDEVTVYASPVVTIILTGNELQQPGKPLQFGQVYESNAVALQTLLQSLQIENVKILHAPDEPLAIQKTLRAALEESDLVLLTGGVSVGDYDFVVNAADACGVQQLFHKIKQRPGKPLYFGRKENKLVFGLPGNPSSVMSCCYQYVLPALQIELVQLKAPLAKAFQKPAGLTHFLKGWFDGEKVTILDAQESYRMSSFAKANCLVKLEEEVTLCKEGELTEIHLL